MDFTLLLFLFVVATALVSLGYHLLVERARKEIPASGSATRKPVLVEYSRALLPVLLLVFALRAFIVEPFRIPSGSMLPSLHIGDFILVNKFSYGLRLPIIHHKIIGIGAPERGDVMVFRFPQDPKVNYIKRVIGLPGDTIVYRDKRLLVNGNPVPRQRDGDFTHRQTRLRGRVVERHSERLDDSTHDILIDPDAAARNMKVVVPPGGYFVMGDNRDRSNDSRYWRFVPEANIVGKAFFIWFSWDSVGGGGVAWSRIGEVIE